MIVNKQNIRELFVNIKTTFNKAFEKKSEDASWRDIAMEVPSSTSKESYKWLSRWPKFVPWVGRKNIKSLQAYKYEIENEKFESTIAVAKDDIEDDNLNGLDISAKGSAQTAAEFPLDLVRKVVKGMFVNKCLDGQPFIDTDHPMTDADGNDYSVSNKGTAKLACDTLAAAEASFGVGYNAMINFKDEEGEYLETTPDTLMVGTKLWTKAKLLMEAEKFADGSENPYKGLCKVKLERAMPEDAWALLDTSKEVKPFIFQNRKKPDFVQSLDDEITFMEGLYLFGLEARGAAGYGFWQLAWASDGSAA